jgi:hypothetical protein
MSNDTNTSTPTSCFQARENRVIRAASLFAQAVLLLEHESFDSPNRRHAVRLRLSRPLSFQRGPLQEAGIDPTAVSFRLDPEPALATKSRSSTSSAVQPALFEPQRWLDPEERSRR